MKDPRKIKQLEIVDRGIDGGFGILRIPHTKKDGTKRYKKATCVFSTGGGWEHVSVALINGNTPTWEDMCLVKDMFWTDEEEVIQIHPKKSEYVNLKDNCLHLWRPTDGELKLPPKAFV
jgi:hypothetical protein